MGGTINMDLTVISSTKTSSKYLKAKADEIFHIVRHLFVSNKTAVVEIFSS